MLDIIKEELLEIKNKFGDDRRTTIDMNAVDYIEDESLIPVENSILALTHNGYIKRMSVDNYKIQNRGGVGVRGMSTNDEDFVESLNYINTHDYVLFFTSKGRVFRMKGYGIPEFSRQSKGLPIVNLLNFDKDEKVSSILKITGDESEKYIVFGTKNGLFKRTAIEEFENIRANGKKAINLKDDDELVSVKLTTGSNEILIACTNGRMIRFNESEIRTMGRTASGVRGIDVGDGKVVDMDISSSDHEVLVVTSNGYGKKTDVEQYRMTHRGSKGVKALNMTDKTGTIVAFKSVVGDEDLIIVTDAGIIIRLSLSQVSNTGRVAQGVKLINLKDEQHVSTVTVLDKVEESEDIEVTENVESNDSKEVVNEEASE